MQWHPCSPAADALCDEVLLQRSFGFVFVHHVKRFVQQEFCCRALVGESSRKPFVMLAQKIIANEVPVYHVNTLPYHTIYSDKVGNPPIGIWGTSTPIDMTYLKE